MSLLSPLGKEREHNFQPGDNVEVCEGELINLQGKILSVDGNKITIMPKHEDLKVAEHAGAQRPNALCGCCSLARMLRASSAVSAGFSSPLGHAGIPSSGAAEIFQDG